MTHPDNLPVYSDDEFDFLEEMRQDLADLANGNVPPKLRFGRLRKATIDRAFTELEFVRLGSSFARNFNDFKLSIEVMRSKDNKGFSIDVGLHPLVMWDEATHSGHPVAWAPFRGRVELPVRRSTWRHGLDEEDARNVLAAAADYLRSNLMSEFSRMIEYCDTTSPSGRIEMPPWLWSFSCSEANFARYRLKAGRLAEAKAFAAAFLDVDEAPSPLAHLREPRPVELEMRSILEA